MTDERTFETMADEYARLISQTVKQAVRSAAIALSADDQFFMDVPELVFHFTEDVARRAYLNGVACIRGWHGMTGDHRPVVESSVSRSALVRKAKGHAEASSREARAELVQSWGASELEYMKQAGVPAMISAIMRHNSLEMFVLGAEEALRRAGGESK